PEAPPTPRRPGPPRFATGPSLSARARRPAAEARARLRDDRTAREGSGAAALSPLEGSGSLQTLTAWRAGDQRPERAEPRVSRGVGAAPVDLVDGRRAGAAGGR